MLFAENLQSKGRYLSKMKLKKEAYGYIIMLGHLCADISGGALPPI